MKCPSCGAAKLIHDTRDVPEHALRRIKSYQGYFLAGGKSVQDPCATSAAMPMLSPNVGCG